MIKFEEHEGLLFRMLEEPVPLKENDVNVLVRFITHGIIGEYVMNHWLDCNQENKPIYIDDVDSDGDVTIWIDEKINSHHCCPFPMFEVIGTLVKEGSADWALHQMMQGEKVFRVEWECDMYCQYTNNEIITFRYGISSTINPVDEWIANAKRADFGWQIYKEPQPAKEPIANCENCKHVCTNSNIDHCHMYEPCGAPSPKSATQTSLPVSDATQLKVGDWVEIESSHAKGKTFVSMIKEMPNQVVVKIGCLSGTVEKAYGEKKGTFILSGLSGQRNVLWLSMLDTETRSLVESLLKAQEEEK